MLIFRCQVKLLSMPNVCSGDVLIKRNNSYFPLFFNFVLFSRFVRFLKGFLGAGY